MPTVAMEGQFRFVVNTRENGFEPPHVRVRVGNEDLCRIELNGDTYMDHPSPRRLSGHTEDVLEIRRGHQEHFEQHSWEVTDGRRADEERKSDDAVRRPA